MTGSALAALTALVAVPGCGEQREQRPEPPNQQGCDDTIEPAGQVPRAMRDQNKRGVGSGDVWFIVPQATRWSELLERRGSEARGKYPLWIDSTRLPEVTVTGVQGTEGTGNAELAPTATGLPGPLPTGIVVPHSGCWQVTARGQSGSATIIVKVVD